MLPGALTTAEFEARKAELQEKKPTVVTYCACGASIGRLDLLCSCCWQSAHHAGACSVGRRGWQSRCM